MAGDGVSLQTNLTQLGNVAKTQSRAQQTGAAGPGQARPLEKEDVKPLEKVRQTEQAEKQRVDPQEERARQHERQRRRDREAAGDEDPTEDGDDGQTEPAAPGIGGLVDTKA